MSDPEEIIAFKDQGGHRTYHFRCPACDEHGDLGLAEGETGMFECPAECGARFIEYQTANGRYAIRCVVQPVFED